MTEALLTAIDEVLFRQVHPTFVRDGRPTSQAFKPTPKDAGRLSVSRSALCEASEAFALYTETRQLDSAGVWGITVGECRDVGLEAHGDPLTSPPDEYSDPAHAVVDFTAIERRKEVEAKAALLLRQAVSRGCLHP